MSNKEKLAFQKSNYILMLIGIVVLIIGFYIMTLDNEDYGFGFLGITLGPVVVMVGYIIEFFAIFHKSKKQ
jgi:uncharacterized Tic20 family protein